MGEVAILNVASGDTKLTFDKNNPAECLRAGRIVKDMLRRGYALLIEVDRDGEKRWERAQDFDEKTSEYLIADFDPIVADVHDKHEALVKLREKEREDGQGTNVQAAVPESTGKGKGQRRRVPASGTKAVSVGRSAGG